MNLINLADIVGGKLIGNDAAFSAISIDTRSLNAGELFVALAGDNFNGHHFLAAAQNKGAVAALVDEDVTTSLPVIRVADTLAALTRWATYHRQQFKIPVLAVTGSCGKTTTKALLASILGEVGQVLATEGTLNNHIGVPLTILRLNATHQFAVIEMGANHPGEIAHLVNIVKPTHATITNIAPVHLEGFGSLEGIANAKTEIFSQLGAAGVAVINADDHYADFMRNKSQPAQCVTFGVINKADLNADIMALNGNGNTEFKLIAAKGEQLIKLPLLGKHNVNNALAAAALAYVLDVPLTAIKSGLEKALPVKKRLNIYHPSPDVTIIDDSYNASPLATKAALEILSQQHGKKIFVFGDMLELGKDAEKYHYEIGQEAARLGISMLYAYGPLTKATVAGFGQQGFHFVTHADLISALQHHIHSPITILVKGSKSMQMGKVVEALCCSG